MDARHPVDEPTSARLLEAALIFTFVIHAIAMVGMALLLLPGMPGGGQSDGARVAYIAGHPWLWRLGWVPWQLTALSDLLLGVALLRTAWVPRGPAWVTLGVTVAALLPDQIGQGLWITRGVTLARQAVATGDAGAYLRFEGWVYPMIAVWACLGYLLGALGWTWCFAAAGVWSRGLTWVSVATWGTFAAAVGLSVLPGKMAAGPFVIAVLNAVAFVLLELWYIGVTERVMRRSRPSGRHGHFAAWRHPGRGPVARSAEWVANSRFCRTLAGALPAPALRSDIRDVVYVNYLADADRLAAWVPPGLTLQRLGPGGRYALFSILTYRHGHFGPRFLGPLRRIMRSPVQSNWRLYVTDPRTGHAGVYFTATAVSNVFYSIGARLLSENVPMHLAERADVARDPGGSLHITLDPGPGSAPDLNADLRPTDAVPWQSPWSEAFPDWTAFLAYCVPQDRALAVQSWRGRVVRQEIQLGIPLDACRPLVGAVESEAAKAIVGDAEPVCFHVPAVTFRFNRAYVSPVGRVVDERSPECAAV